MKTLTIIALLAGSIYLNSCEDALLSPQFENTAIDNFECLWSNYDLYYGQFYVRNINWDSIYAVHRPFINEQTTELELYDIFKRMVYHFHDDHVFIDPTVSALPRIESGRSDTMKIQIDFSADLISSDYLISEKQYSEHIGYGLLPGNIGYIRMYEFSGSMEYIGKAFDRILNELKETKGIVFDIRRLEGGDDRIAKYVAGRFASETNLYMISRKRNGPSHDDFEKEIRWYVAREGEFQYTLPVVLLTGRFTASAGETFTWAMNENDHVIQVGDTTLGAFSDVMVKELPNGWLHTIAVGDYRNASGESLEGVGIAPDIYSRSTKSDILSGIDKGLDKAIEILERNYEN
jgi:carboxyl-terminal processing protease